MRPYRANLSLRPIPQIPLRATHNLHLRPFHPSTLKSRFVRLNSTKQAPYELPPSSHFKESSRRFSRFDPDTAYDPSTSFHPARNPLNYVDSERSRYRANQYYKRRMLIAGIGLACCIVVQIGLIFTFGDEYGGGGKKDAAHQEKRTVENLDAAPGAPSGPGQVRVVGQKPGVPEVKLDAEGNELVETGTSSVPHLPRTIRLPAATTTLTAGDEEEYTLLGHGIRTVSFLSIQVYVLGVYVRTADLPALQAALVRRINPMGTSLIPGEKAELRRQLLDGEGSREVWEDVLRESGVRSVVRVVPTRGTGFSHLRDGWVRGIRERCKEAARRAESGTKEKKIVETYEDEGFGRSVAAFNALFNGRGNTPKGSIVILHRDEKGLLSVSYQGLPDAEGKLPDREGLGAIEDERLSRLVWMGYLAGKNVSSEPARKSVVDGVMELVERPVGTVGVGAA